MLLVVAIHDEEQEDFHVVKVVICVQKLEERSRFKGVLKLRTSLSKIEILDERLAFNNPFHDLMFVLNLLLGWLSLQPVELDDYLIEIKTKFVDLFSPVGFEVFEPVKTIRELQFISDVLLGLWVLDSAQVRAAIWQALFVYILVIAFNATSLYNLTHY